MNRLIRDVQPPELAQESLDTVTTDNLVEELYRRGVTISDIFSTYYALDAQGDNLTVGDVELAGLASLPEVPNPRQPF